MSRLKKHYFQVVRPDILIKGSFKSIMEIPELKKITLNMSVKDTIQDKKAILSGLITLERISGQRPTITRAKKSVASYSLKEGAIIGCKVSLTGDSMYNFLDKLVYIVLPRVKELKALKLGSFNGHGNYALGLSDLLVFPEIESEYGKIPKSYGMDIIFVTNTSSDIYGQMILSGLQLPFLPENKT